jgi:hypothetical protein
MRMGGPCRRLSQPAPSFRSNRHRGCQLAGDADPGRRTQQDLYADAATRILAASIATSRFVPGSRVRAPIKHLRPRRSRHLAAAAATSRDQRRILGRARYARNYVAAAAPGRANTDHSPSRPVAA